MSTTLFTQALTQPATLGLVAAANPDSTLLNFLDGNMPAGLAFSRASSGTDFSAAGTLTSEPLNAPRFDFNPTTLQPRGLLIEGARTNLLLNSAVLSTQNITVTAVAHTISFYGTGSVTLSGAATGTLNGTGAFPNRAQLTFTPSAGTLTVTVTGSVLNANCGPGSFASSWIPTTAATATRAGEAARISDLAAVSFNPTAFTILCEIDGGNLVGPGATAALPWSLRNTAGTTGIRPYVGGSTMAIYADTNSVLQYNSPIPGSQDPRGQASYRIAVTAGPLGLRAAAKGSSVVTNLNPSYAMGSFTTLDIGQSLGGGHLFGHVSSLVVRSGEMGSTEILNYINGV